MIHFDEIINNWEYKDDKKLFFLENRGCDATTRGLAEMDYYEFLKFAEIADNLNSNSYYSCMPTINCEETSWDCFEEYEVRLANIEKRGDDKYDFCNDKFPLNGKVYTYKFGHDQYTVNFHAPARVYYKTDDELEF